MFKTSAPTPFIRASFALHGVAAFAVLIAPAYWHWALAAITANHLVITATGLWPRSTWLGPNWVRLPAAAAARNEVALTIDDGPDPAVTPQVLDLLDRHAVKATFFCVGVEAARHPTLCREIVRRGHAVENHSQHHRHSFSFLGPRGYLRELQAAQTTLGQLAGEAPLFFRAPAGLRNPFLAPVLTRLGLTLASWSARGFDTRVGNPAQVRQALLDKLRPGAILLLHDGHSARTEAGTPVILDVLPDLFDAAASAGLHWVRLRDART
ncbi:MAG: polysaccharide deacetylase family protein [Thiobacillus sp.]|nr:polysaccharide deacetylase family protein [Thiobacillus sp.]